MVHPVAPCGAPPTAAQTNDRCGIVHGNDLENFGDLPISKIRFGLELPDADAVARCESIQDLRHTLLARKGAASKEIVDIIVLSPRH